MRKKLDPHFQEYLTLMRVLWRKKSVSRDGRALYAWLLTFENLKTNKAKPGQRLICQELQMSRTTLGKLLDELSSKGLLLFSQEPKKNGNLLVYTLIAPQPDSKSSGAENVVPFPSRISTNSTRSTTPLDGNLGSM